MTRTLYGRLGALAIVCSVLGASGAQASAPPLGRGVWVCHASLFDAHVGQCRADTGMYFAAAVLRSAMVSYSRHDGRALGQPDVIVSLAPLGGKAAAHAFAVAPTAHTWALPLAQVAAAMRPVLTLQRHHTYILAAVVAGQKPGLTMFVVR